MPERQKQATVQRLRRKGVTQGDIAKACGLSQASISHQLLGRRRITPDVLQAASRLSNIPISILFPDGLYEFADERRSELARERK